MNNRGKFEEKVVTAEFKVRNDNEIKEELRQSKDNIYEIKDFWRIKYKGEGREEYIERRHGKDKEKAHEKIKSEQENLCINPLA